MIMKKMLIILSVILALCTAVFCACGKKDGEKATETTKVASTAENAVGGVVTKAGEVAGDVVTGAGDIAGAAVSDAGKAAGDVVTGAGDVVSQAASDIAE